MLRPLTNDEIFFINGIASRLDSQVRDRLMSDLATAHAEVRLADESIIQFHLGGYERPHYVGRRLYPVEGKMNDADGSPMDVLLFADPGDRLYDLEYVRWENGRIEAPQWSILQFVP